VQTGTSVNKNQGTGESRYRHPINNVVVSHVLLPSRKAPLYGFFFLLSSHHLLFLSFFSFGFHTTPSSWIRIR
jgi:hypothetical protein